MNLDKIHKVISIFSSTMGLILIAIFKYSSGTDGVGEFAGVKISIEVVFYFGLFFLIGFILYIFFEDMLREYFFNRNLKKQRIREGVIIEKKTAMIQFVDRQGKLAMFKEEVFFKKIGKNHEAYTSKMHLTGSIDENSIRKYNCNIDVNDDKNFLKVSYHKPKEDSGVMSEYLDKRLYYGFSANLQDSFITSKENWHLDIENYTIHYEIILIFPPDRIPKKCTLVKLSEEDKPEEIIDKKPLLLGSTLYVNLFHLDSKKNYDIKWEW